MVLKCSIAASSDSLVQNSSCIVDNEVLYPCATLDGLINDFTFSFATNNGNISIYLIHDTYFINTNLNLLLSNFSMVEMRIVWVTFLSGMLMSE